MLHKTLNIRGTLTSLDTPLVMGILNVTPDSFYADSRKQTEVAIEERIQAILSEGGQIIDLGGYSSRPDAAEVSPEEEMKRLAFALKILNTHYPDVTLSVDTFRADVARRCVEEYGVPHPPGMYRQTGSHPGGCGTSLRRRIRRRDNQRYFGRRVGCWNV